MVIVPLLTQDALDAHARLLHHVLPHLEYLTLKMSEVSRVDVGMSED